ncbi:MAG: acyltransferase [Planctomycetes bacterium]|nr:acyltransferase [Planctomycetota bacterium]
MPTISDTRDVTSYLKGFAITVVLINHYVNYYVTDTLRWYAHGTVSIFFVLSGYGIFYSLNKMDTQSKNKTAMFLGYFHSRAARIVPLYWVSLIIVSLLSRQFFPLKAFLMVKASGPYWFVIFLVHCYLVAPWLYLFIKRFGQKIYLVSIGILMLLAHFYYSLVLSANNSGGYFVYRHLFLGHIFLFALGMSIPGIIPSEPGKFANKILAAVMFFIFAIALFYTRHTGMIFPNSEKYFAFLFVISSFAFCLFSISSNTVPPLRRIFILLGTHSYPLYLFHHSFYAILSKVGILKYRSLQGTVLMILLFPVFVLICIAIEKAVNRFIGCVQVSEKCTGNGKAVVRSR